MHWSQQYIGIRYLLGGRDRSGLDCWGLVRLFFLEHNKVELPMLPGLGEERLLRTVTQIWTEAKSHWREVHLPVDGDVVGMGRKETLHHVGLWTPEDGCKIVHCMGTPVRAETVRQLKLQGLKTFRYFRYGPHH